MKKVNIEIIYYLLFFLIDFIICDSSHKANTEDLKDVLALKKEVQKSKEETIRNKLKLKLSLNLDYFEKLNAEYKNLLKKKEKLLKINMDNETKILDLKKQIDKLNNEIKIKKLCLNKKIVENARLYSEQLSEIRKFKENMKLLRDSKILKILKSIKNTRKPITKSRKTNGFIDDLCHSIKIMIAKLNLGKNKIKQSQLNFFERVNKIIDHFNKKRICVKNVLQKQLKEIEKNLEQEEKNEEQIYEIEFLLMEREHLIESKME